MKHRNRCVFKAYNKSVCERGGGIDTKQERERVCYCDRVHLPDLVLEKKVKDGEMERVRVRERERERP